MLKFISISLRALGVSALTLQLKPDENDSRLERRFPPQVASSKTADMASLACDSQQISFRNAAALVQNGCGFITSRENFPLFVLGSIFSWMAAHSLCSVFNMIREQDLTQLES